ncbi:MAG: hypothetical protein ABI726_05075 [bacterium]
MNERKRKRMAELDAMEAEQKAKREAHTRELRAELQDRRVQRGIAALIRDASAKIAADLAESNTAQVTRLALRLVELDLIDLNDDEVPEVEGTISPENEIGVLTINSVLTGEIVVAIEDGESLFHEHGSDVIEQRPARGRIEFRRIGPDGSASDWQFTPPPPTQAASN